MKKTFFFLLITSIILATFLLIKTSVHAQSVPTIISHQGRLLNASNQPVTTNVSVVFSIYDAASGGSQVWTETQSITPDSLGFYETFLGGTTPLPSTLPNPSYLQIQVQSETLTPRLQFGSVPFAQKAGNADLLDNLDSTVFSQLGPSIESSEIADGTIANIDVSGTAAIAGSKISPDFGSQNIFTSGNIGIGTTSATNRLNIQGSFSGYPLYIKRTDTGDYTHSLIRVECSATSNRCQPGIQFVRPSGRLWEIAEGSGDIVADVLGFYNNLSGTVMVITPSGNLGIGTTNPAQKLDVAGTIQLTGFKLPTGATNGYVLTSDAAGVGTWQAAPGGGGSGGWTDDGAAVRLTTDTDSVGIGTSTPGTKLDVAGTIRTNNQLISTVSTGTAPLSVSSSTKVTNLNSDLLDGIDSGAFSKLGSSIESSEIADGTIANIDISATAGITGTKISPDFGSQMITTTGCIGIGGACVENNLYITGDFSNTPFAIRGTGGSLPLAQFICGTSGQPACASVIEFRSTNGTSSFSSQIIQGMSGDLFINNQVAAGADITIAGSGNVGIGTNNPQSRLQVSGNYIQFPTISGTTPPAADCDNFAEAGRVVVRTDGTTNLYVCTWTGGTGVWVGK